jgi:hypothetical protein
MNRLVQSIAMGAVLSVSAASAQAQIRQGTRVGTNSPIGSVGTTVYSSANIPPGQMPPAGMCRIWIDGVPPGRQPAPTDCTTAQRNVPANGRVIYGSQAQPSYPNRNYPAGTMRNGRYDPRLDPRSPQYDPRLDRTNRRYDPRYDPYRTGTSGRSDRDQAQWERERQQRQIEQARLERERQWREQQRVQKDQLKDQRKAQKEREKEWKKEHKGDKGHGNGKDHDDNGNHGH